MTDILEQLKKEYHGIQKIEKEDISLIIYADDNTLWKIFEDFRDTLNMEFEAGSKDKHFIRIMKY